MPAPPPRPAAAGAAPGAAAADRPLERADRQLRHQRRHADRPRSRHPGQRDRLHARPRRHPHRASTRAATATSRCARSSARRATRSSSPPPGWARRAPARSWRSPGAARPRPPAARDRRRPGQVPAAGQRRAQPQAAAAREPAARSPQPTRRITVSFSLNTIKAPPPPAVGGDGKWLGGFELTEYYPALESWFAGRPVRAPGLRGLHRIDWLYSARGLSMEGDGIGLDGQPYHIAGLGSGGWLTAGGGDGRQVRGRRRRAVLAHRRLLAQRPAGALTFPLADGGWSAGVGSATCRRRPGSRSRPGQSRPLSYLRSVAVDPRLIPLGQPHLHPRLRVGQRRLVRGRRHRRRDHRPPHRRLPPAAGEPGRPGQLRHRPAGVHRAARSAAALIRGIPDAPLDGRPLRGRPLGLAPGDADRRAVTREATAGSRFRLTISRKFFGVLMVLWPLMLALALVGVLGLGSLKSAFDHQYARDTHAAEASMALGADFASADDASMQLLLAGGRRQTALNAGLDRSVLPAVDAGLSDFKTMDPPVTATEKKQLQALQEGWSRFLSLRATGALNQTAALNQTGASSRHVPPPAQLATEVSGIFSPLRQITRTQAALEQAKARQADTRADRIYERSLVLIWIIGAASFALGIGGSAAVDPQRACPGSGATRSSRPRWRGAISAAGWPRAVQTNWPRSGGRSTRWSSIELWRRTTEVQRTSSWTRSR